MRPLPAGPGRGRLLSRHDPLFDVVVPPATAPASSAIFMAAIPISIVIGAPISGAILRRLNGVGLQGWQWLFILEAVPALSFSASW